MSDSSTDLVIESYIVPSPHSEVAAIHVEVMGEEAGSSGVISPFQTGHVEELAEGDAETSLIGQEVAVDASFPEQSEATIADSQFHIFAGPGSTRFTIDINDLRRESALFREIPSITSIEMRHENPEAVRLIYNWFCGHLGTPPLTPDARQLFIDAADIAGKLHINECESQLFVVVARVTRTITNMNYAQLQSNRLWTEAEMMEYVMRDVASYMIRSTNVGGRDDSDEEEADLYMAAV